MAYKFHIEPYCENCPEFEVDAKRDDIYEEDLYPFTAQNGGHYICQTIGCKHRKRCANMVNWLSKKKLEKENE